jgi:hypothetical protein
VDAKGRGALDGKWKIFELFAVSQTAFTLVRLGAFLAEPVDFPGEVGKRPSTATSTAQTRARVQRASGRAPRLSAGFRSNVPHGPCRLMSASRGS